jgi:hypothetical protein
MQGHGLFSRSKAMNQNKQRRNSYFLIKLSTVIKGKERNLLSRSKVKVMALGKGGGLHYQYIYMITEQSVCVVFAILTHLEPSDLPETCHDY